MQRLPWRFFPAGGGADRVQNVRGGAVPDWDGESHVPAMPARQVWHPWHRNASRRGHVMHGVRTRVLFDR